jgi:hypothetical protein
MFLYFGSPWIAFFLSAAGVPNDRRDRILAAIMAPECWLYYAPAASALLYFAGIAMFCGSRSLALWRRNREQQTR